MATIPAATAVTPAGVIVSGALATAAASSMTMANDGRTMLAVYNGSGSGITVTPTSQAVVPDGGATPLSVQDRAVSIATLETQLIGPFPPGVYNDANGEVTLVFSSATTVTVKAFRCTPVAP